MEVGHSVSFNVSAPWTGHKDAGWLFPKLDTKLAVLCTDLAKG